MTEEKQDKNPVIKTVHGVPIRENNTICIRLNASAYEDLIEQSHKTSISMTKILVLRQEPCQQCGCDNVTLILKKNKYSYRIGENGGTQVNNINGKGHNDTPENINS